MDIRPLSPTFAVSAQISAEDIPAIVDAGYKTIICNRPDMEVPPNYQSAAIGAAAQAAGLSFIVLPVTHHGLGIDLITTQKAQMADATGPILAYCASGTRSSIVWSLTQAGEMPTDQIIAATAAAGYDLGGMGPQIDAFANR